MSIDPIARPWWRRVFKRKSSADEGRVSALPPKLDLPFGTPTGSRLDVTFDNVAYAVPESETIAEPVETAAHNFKAAAVPEQRTYKQQPEPLVVEAPPLSPPRDTPTSAVSSVSPTPSPWPTEQQGGFHPRVQSATRGSASGRLAPRNESLEGYNVTTYVPANTAADVAPVEVAEAKHQNKWDGPGDYSGASSGSSGDDSHANSSPYTDSSPYSSACGTFDNNMAYPANNGGHVYKYNPEYAEEIEGEEPAGHGMRLPTSSW